MDLEPQNKWYRTRLIECLTVLGAKQEIVVHQKYLVAQYPEKVQYKYELANTYLSMTDYFSCIGVLDDIEAQLGINEKLSVQKSELYEVQNKPYEAVQELKKLSDAFPNNVEFLGMLAQAYMKYGPMQEAEKAYSRMLEIAPDDPRAHLDLANYYRSRNNIDQSVYHLRIAMGSPQLDIDPKISVLVSLYSISQSDSNLNVLAYDLLDTLILVHPKDPKAYSVYSDYLARDNKTPEAIRYLKKAMALGATQRQILEQILILEIESHQYDSLIKDAGVMIELYPNQPTGYMMQGVAYAELDKHQEAVSIWETAVLYSQSNPTLLEQLHMYLADSYHRLEDHSNSDLNYQQVLEINPKNAIALNNYAYYLSLRNVELERALKMTKTSNVLYPNNAVYLDTWAWVLYKMGLYEEALQKIDLALKHAVRQSSDLLEHKGDILFRLERKKEAVHTWEQARESGDKSPRLLKKIEDQQLYE